ncbi:uncharacterized protein L199_000681 [Kwoniella botswanensis]|uniref:uncharacterized protein n=1 Tax=Kwoniella botswanensis TaxID=1268659 RepID=UPI00315DD6B9
MLTTTPSGSSKHTRSEDEDQIHWFHRFGDLQLRSTDKIIFTVFSERLRAVSSVFKDMMDIGQQKSSTTGTKRKSPPDADVIDVGFESKTLEIFLDMINVPKPSPLTTDFVCSLRLHEFCDKFDITGNIKDMVKTRLLQCTSESYAWDLLIWSAERNDTDMARKALARMTGRAFISPQFLDNKSNARISIDFWAAISKLPAIWQHDLLRLALQSDKPSEGRYSYLAGPHLAVTTDWSSLATRFKPSE